MSKINWTRILLGGIVAGVVINIFEYVVNGLVLGDDWVAAMQAIGKSGDMGAGVMVVFGLVGLAIGLLAIWVYAAIRPRFGPGVKTAVCAGLAVWFATYFLPTVSGMPMDVFPVRLMVIAVSVGIVEVLAGTIAGAWIYRERSDSTSGDAPAHA